MPKMKGCAMMEDKKRLAATISQMRRNEYIQEKELGGSLSSFNFTREAFQEGIWDDQTMRARGLFIDTAVPRIVARSYDKFFAVDERPETQLGILAPSLSYPVDVYVKENGFLGIVAPDGEGDLLFASKSTIDSDFARWCEEIVRSEIGDDGADRLRKRLEELDATAVFEIVDPVRDPHIVLYGEPKAVLLDVVSRTLDLRLLGYDELCDFARECGCKVKERVATIEDADGFASWYRSVADEDASALDDECIEGYVFIDAAQRMGKVKLSWYRTWKMLRGVLRRMSRLSRRSGYEADELYEDAMKRFGPQRAKAYEENGVADIVRFLADYAYMRRDGDDVLDIVAARQAWEAAQKR